MAEHNGDAVDTTAQEANGASAPTFPVDSFREAAPHLRRPFTAEAVKFKVQATWPKEKPTGGLIVAYIDARLAVERLNAVCPHLWSDDYASMEGGKLLCRLTVDDITRSDIGEGYQGKGLYSDALKRAAVKFGVGVSLYAIPKLMLTKRDGLKDARTKQGPTLQLTDQGEAHCCALYTDWLHATGEAKFGDALDHGDVEGSVGDPDAELGEPADNATPASTPAAIPDFEPLAEAQARELYDAATKAGVDAATLQRAVAHLAGRDPGDLADRDEAIARMVILSSEQADRLASWIAQKAEQQGATDGS